MDEMCNLARLDFLKCETPIKKVKSQNVVQGIPNGDLNFFQPQVEKLGFSDL